MRVTMKMLRGRMNRLREVYNIPFGLDISGAPKQPRLGLCESMEQPAFPSQDLSPRGTPTMVMMWLEAFMKGYHYKEDTHKEDCCGTCRD